MGERFDVEVVLADGAFPARRVRRGQRMFHPMHLHGHTFQVAGGGARKDTIIVRPMQQVDVDFDADNPGQWVTHWHNIYHAVSGMMVTVSYGN